MKMNMKYSLFNSIGLKPSKYESDIGVCFSSGEADLNNPSINTEEVKFFEPHTPSSSRSDDQPLDLSKSSSNASPESFFDDDMSERSSKDVSAKKRRYRSNVMSYTKKRSRTSSQYSQRGRTSSQLNEGANKYAAKSSKVCRKSSSQSNRDSLETLLTPEEELIKNLDRSLKRQREGFIMVRLSECDCSPHFESQRRKEERTITCELMMGREPFLQLARLKNYEFSTLRRAKFSSLAMVKHLAQSFNLDPICNSCFSFDSSKRHYACSICIDFYLCTSCHENTYHAHNMSLVPPSTMPDIDEFLPQCSLASATNSISSASSTISNKSFNETSLELPPQPYSSTSRDLLSNTGIPLHHHLSNTLDYTSSMPLSCKRQRNRELSDGCAGDEENANISLFAPNSAKSPNQTSPPPSHSSTNTRSVLELDQVLIENFVRHAEHTYNIDFDEMKSESKKLLTHYWSCPIKNTCCRCKFVVLSCSFMSFLLKNNRMQMMLCNSDDVPLVDGTSNENNHSSGINLTMAHRFSYQPKD